MNSDFFQDGYKIPETSNYMKFAEGDNTFRVLSSAVVGYEYFNTANKPVRSREAFEGIPEDIKMVKDDKGKTVPGKINHFWAFVVYNKNAERIQILEITQKSIMKTMQSYIKNPKWGNPRQYDFMVNRTGSGFDTEYAVSVNPKEDIDPTIIDKFEKMSINLDALFDGGDPFQG